MRVRADVTFGVLALFGLLVVSGCAKKTEQSFQPSEQAKKGAATKMTEPIVGTSANFDSEVLKSPTPAVVDFWAPWCGPCRAVSPIIDELAGDYAGKVKVVKVNIDEQPELANKYGIRAIPTIVFFRNGEKVDEVVGVESKSVLSQKFRDLTE